MASSLWNTVMGANAEQAKQDEFIDDTPKVFSIENFVQKFGININVPDNKDIDDPTDFLTPFEVEIVNTVLTDIIDQLTIVNKGQVRKTPIVYKPPLQQRFNNVEEKLYNVNTFEKIEQELDRLTLSELENNIGEMINLIAMTVEDLKDNGSYRTLKEYVKETERVEREENELIENYVYNKRRVKVLEEKLNSSIAENDKISKDLDILIFDLENKISDCIIENKMKYHLIEEWEKSRVAQTAIKNSIEEDNLRNQWQYYVDELHREDCVHSEMSDYLNTCINEIDNLTNYWSDRYDTETQALDLEVQITQDQIADTQSRFEELSDMYNERQTHIDEYLEYRRKRDDEIARAKLKFDSCVKLQAWWRGTMVRRGLGAFKKAKKKGKKNK